MQRREEAQVGFMQKLIGFFGWVFTGFGLLKNQKSRMAAEEVTVYAVHQSFFVWLLVLVPSEANRRRPLLKIARVSSEDAST